MMRKLNMPGWTPAAAAALGVIGVLTAGGLAVADAVTHPEPASAGRRVDVRYQVVRAPPYAPPPVTEEARLDVRPAGPVAPDPAFLPVAVEAAWRTLESTGDADIRRTLAQVRAEDARLDRQLRADLARMRAETHERSEARPAEPEPASDG